MSQDVSETVNLTKVVNHNQKIVFYVESMWPEVNNAPRCTKTFNNHWEFSYNEKDPHYRQTYDMGKDSE